MEKTLLNDRYLIKDEIGQGGMGTVFLAHDQVLNRDVAIKELSNFKLGTEGKARLLAEAQTVAQLNHPNIVSVHDAGEEDGIPFIVMEYVEGQTLRENAPTTWDDILEVTRQICSSLEHAHAHDVIHRDLKPENVIIDPDGNTNLMDFGIAHSVSSRITSDGMIIGTVFYMSPEQAMGKSVDVRSDLYSLGVMLYEFATGDVPFSDLDAIAVISQHINAPIVPPRAKRSDIPPGLDALILALLEKEPEDRPDSATAILKILDDPLFLDTGAIPAKEITLLDRIVRGRMIGRSNELQQARALWKDVSLGNGQSLLISGEPGIGKTRLVKEIVTHAEVTGGQTFVGESYAEGGVPYDAFTQIVRQVLNQKNGKEIDLPDFVLADLIDLSPELKPYYPDIEPNPALDPESHQRRLFENMVALCTKLAKNGPLLLVVDDAHWSDSGTLHMMRHLMRRTRNQPIMLIATYREVELDEALPFHEVMLDLNRERLGARIKLSRLEREQTSNLLGVIFDEEITPDFLEGIYKETEGNPFFIEEVCKALVESGKVFAKGDGWDRVEVEELEIPQGVKVAIQYRVSKLPESSKDAMVAAAVIGREFDFSTLLKVIEGDEESLITAVEDAVKAQLIDELRHKGTEHFSFSHALIPAALRETLGGLRRSRLHRRVAASIEELRPEDYELLAYHYGEAGDEERGLEFTIKAAERAKESYANEEAVGLYTEALAIVPKDGPQRFSLLEGRARAFGMLAKRVKQGSDIGEMLSLAEKLNNDNFVVDALVAQADYFMRADKLGDQMTAAKRAVEIAEKLEDPVRLARSYDEYGVAFGFSGEYSKQEEILRKAIDLYRQENMLGKAAEALGRLSSSLRNLDKSEEAFETLQEALTMSRKAQDPEVEARLLGRLSFANGIQGNYTESLSNFEQARTILQNIGNVQLLCYNFIFTAFVHRMLGNQEENITNLQSALNIAWEIDEPSILLFAIRDYALYNFFYPGDVTDGLSFLAEQVSIAKDFANPNAAVMVRFAQAIFQMFIGQYEIAEKMIAEIQSEERDLGDFFEWIFVLYIGCCKIGMGNTQEALTTMGPVFTNKMKITENRSDIAEMLTILAWAELLGGDKSNYDPALDKATQAIASYENFGFSFSLRVGYCIALDVATRLHLALGDKKSALEISNKLAEIVENEIIEITAPYFYTHSLALRASGNEEDADTYLQKAYDRVTSVGDKIDDPEIKTAWLETNRQNREILEAYKASPLSKSPK